jgi:hypothetical protein
MIIPIIISVGITIICFLFQKITPLFLGMVVYFILINRNITNKNFIVQDENNVTFRDDIDTLKQNQNVLNSNMNKFIKMFYAKKKTDERNNG